MEEENDERKDSQNQNSAQSSNKKISFQEPKPNRSSKAILKLGKDDSSFDYNPPKENRVSRYFSKKKSNIIITEDTLIYDILIDYLSDDSKKIRNYERVSNEIKKIEQKNVVERTRLRRKITIIQRRLDVSGNKNNSQNKDENKLFEIELNLRNRTLEMKSLSNNNKINYIVLIQKLRISPEYRIIKDILKIKPYIEKTNLAKTFNEEFTDKTIVEKLINFCCIEMYYKKYKEGEIIYKIGDAPTEFYSIIFGKVNLIKTIQEIKIMSGFEYFYHLMNLRKNNESYFFHKTIADNMNNYKIKENHIEIIHYIYLYNYLKGIKNSETQNISITNLLQLINVNPEDLGMDITQINSINYLSSSAKLVKKFLNNMPEQVFQKYSFLDDDIIKKEVKIYKNEICNNLKFNDYFGDDAVNDIHTLTAIADDITEVAVLPIKLYNSEIANLKSMVLEKKIYELYSSHFFNQMKYFNFKRKFFKLFSYEKYYNGDILFTEGEKAQYVYFIQEGNVQLYTSKSINDIESLMSLLIKKKKLLRINNMNNSEKENDDELKYSKINSTYEDLVNYLDKKQNNKLLFLSNKEEIGLVSNFCGSEYITSCAIVSKEAKIYKIDVKYINRMLIEEGDCIDDYNIRLESKMNLLIQRLFKVNNIKLIMLDEKIKIEKNNKKSLDEKEILLNNSSKIRGLVNYNKLNYILTEKSLNNSNSKGSIRDMITLPNIKPSEQKISFSEIFSSKEKSSIQSPNKNSIFKKQFYSLNNDDITKNSPRKKDHTNNSRHKLFMLLNNNMRYNSGSAKKSSKMKLYKKKQDSIEHKILEELFITKANNNSISNSQIKNKNNSRIKKNSFSCNIHIETEGDKSHNHPYYEPKMLIKRNKYKIFENVFNNKKTQIENIKMKNIRLRQLQNIHSPIKNYKIFDDDNNIIRNEELAKFFNINKN